MTISPFYFVKSKVRRIPVGVMRGNGLFMGEKDARIVYCGAANAPLRLAREHGGVATIARTAGGTRWIKFDIGGVEYYPGLQKVDVNQVIAWRDFCHDLGINAASIAAMAFRVMRATLPGYFAPSKGSHIPFRSHYPPGPRMHATPGIYSDVIQSDIRAAYLWGVGTFSPPRAYREHRRRIRIESVAEADGSFALVHAKFPKVKWGAIPVHNSQGQTVYPEHSGMADSPVLLSSYDISLGLMMGVKFRALAAWYGVDCISEPFRAYMYEIWSMRYSSKFPDIAKQAGNTLWGNFAASSRTATIIFRPQGRSTIEKGSRPALCLPIAYSVIGRLRSRLYSEGIGSETIHAHTDGVMGYRSLADADTHLPGCWRDEQTFREVEILAPSWYRVVKQDGTSIYKMAGRRGTSDAAARHFAHARDKFSRGERTTFSRMLEESSV